MRAPRIPAGATELVLPDRGSRVWLLLRAGVVVGAFGCEPASWLGLTEADARQRSETRT